MYVSMYVYMRTCRHAWCMLHVVGCVALAHVPGACEPKWPASTQNLAEQPRIPSLLPQPERSLWLKLDVNQKYDLRADGHEAV